VAEYNDYVNAQKKFDEYIKVHGDNMTEELAQKLKPVHDTIRTYEFDLEKAVSDLPTAVLKTQGGQAQKR
jgi:hypothetical protein